jgi:hypothetical protein
MAMAEDEPMLPSFYQGVAGAGLILMDCALPYPRTEFWW